MERLCAASGVKAEGVSRIRPHRLCAVVLGHRRAEPAASLQFSPPVAVEEQRDGHGNIQYLKGFVDCKCQTRSDKVPLSR